MKIILNNMLSLSPHLWVTEIEFILLILLYLVSYLTSMMHMLYIHRHFACLCYLWILLTIVQPRAMVPQKDAALYGYGSVAWKDRMEEWKKRQGDRLQVVKHEGGDGPDDGDLPT